MIELMNKNYKERGEYNGFFILKGIKSGLKNFNDYWIYINNLDKTGYDALKAINNTEGISAQKDLNLIS
jgi:hypothetical protein